MFCFGVALVGSNGHASGLPEWGMSSGAASFMIRAVAIKSPPLNAPAPRLHKWDGNYVQPRASTSNWLEGYEVSLTNVTMIHWTRPVIQYVVYATDSAGQIQQVHGTEALNEIPVNGQITIITNQVMMQHIVSGDGHNTLPGKLLGVWVRIYNSRHVLIEDYAAPWDFMVWRRWEFPGGSRQIAAIGMNY